MKATYQSLKKRPPVAMLRYPANDHFSPTLVGLNPAVIACDSNLTQCRLGSDPHGRELAEELREQLGVIDTTVGAVASKLQIQRS